MMHIHILLLIFGLNVYTGIGTLQYNLYILMLVSSTHSIPYLKHTVVI